MVKKVALLGMGAVGAIYARILGERLPAGDFYAIMDEERARRLLVHGFYINGEPLIPPIIPPRAGRRDADLVIVALKYRELPDALPAIASHVGDDTQLLLLLNGLASEEMAAALYGWERVLYSVAIGVDPRRRGNNVDTPVNRLLVKLIHAVEEVRGVV